MQLTQLIVLGAQQQVVWKCGAVWMLFPLAADGASVLPVAQEIDGCFWSWDEDVCLGLAARFQTLTLAKCLDQAELHFLAWTCVLVECRFQLWQQNQMERVGGAPAASRLSTAAADRRYSPDDIFDTTQSLRPQ